jgi:hypothetical protein
MTKAAAIYQFWSGFLTAYEENTVPEDATFPYLTYQFASDSVGGDIPLTASLWYRSESWVEANAKAEEISKAIGLGGKILSFDGGKIWIRRGIPFSQNMGDESDSLIKRKYLNISVEFISAD